MKNAIESGDQVAQKVLKTMLRKVSTKTMNDKMNKITHGERSGIDDIEIPRGEWFKSEKNKEIYRHKNGVFEAYPSNGEKEGEYKKYHVIKVIPDDAVEVQVEEEDKELIMKSVGERIQWETIDTREKIEKHLSKRNKQHIQQVAKEKGIPMQEWFQKLIGNDRYSEKGGRVLEGDIEWEEIPNDPEIRAWLKAVIRN